MGTEHLDGLEGAQVEAMDLPATFDESVVLLDVRKDDEWVATAVLHRAIDRR